MSYLVGDNMTGGYGAADILHGCNIIAEKGEIAHDAALFFNPVPR